MGEEVSKFYDSIGSMEEIILIGLGGPLLFISFIAIFLGGAVFLAQFSVLIRTLANKQPVTHSEYYSPKVEDTKAPQPSSRGMLLLMLPTMFIIIFGVTNIVSLKNTEGIEITQERILDKLVIKAVNETQDDSFIIDDSITESFTHNRIYTLDFTIEGKNYREKEILILLDKQGEYTKQGFVKPDMSIFSEDEKKFLDEAYNTFRGDRSSKNLSEIDYLYVIKPLESEG